MKFWQKAFFCIIAVFLLGFDIMGYVLAERSYTLNRDYALTAAEVEQQVIEKSIIQSLSLISPRYPEVDPEKVQLIILPYGDFYQNQGIYFQLYQGNTLVFDNLPVDYREQKELAPGVKFTEIKEVEGRLFCFITTAMDQPYPNMKLVYIKDMEALAQFKEQIIKTYVSISIVVSLILAIIMLFLLIGLTRPFRRLNAVAAEISRGHYEKRVPVQSRDEIGEFAENFNLMADHIEAHIAELSRMTESKQRFIDNLTHEIRTPITAILGYGELLKYANCSESERQTAIDHIISQSKRIQVMAYKLLDLASMGRGSDSIIMGDVKLKELIPDVEAAIAPQRQEKAIRLDWQLQADSIQGDPELIKSLLINLLDNGIKASENGGLIEVRAYPVEKGTTIEVIDHGRGMDEAEIAKITEPFYRVEKSRSRSEGGVGLGLALCARIIEVHQATWEITSQIGKGTTVRITFTTL